MKAVVLILSSHPVYWWLADVASHIMSLSPSFAVSISLHKPEKQKSYLTNKCFFHSTDTASETWALPRTMEKNLTESEVSGFHRICNFVRFAMFSQIHILAWVRTETETILVLLMDSAWLKKYPNKTKQLHSNTLEWHKALDTKLPQGLF